MRKADITPELVTCLLQAQFPQWAELPVTAVELDGWDNTTFRLGEEMSVRLPSDDMYVTQVDKEHRYRRRDERVGCSAGCALDGPAGVGAR